MTLGKPRTRTHELKCILIPKRHMSVLIGLTGIINHGWVSHVSKDVLSRTNKIAKRFCW